MSEQNNIPNDQQTKIWEILREVEKKSAGGGYIYRGEPECYEKVSSGLYRKYECIKIRYFNIGVVQEEILEKAKQYTDKTNEFEILAELQHYGGQTNLIDFTTDYHIALFFACDGSDFHDKCGRLILWQKRESYFYQVYQPREPRNRVIAQKSIFVRPDAGFIEPDEVIIIPAELKQPLLNHLRDYHGISSETIYNDLHGFIKNQAIHESAYTAFYTGLTYQNTGKYKQAIEQYDKSIELNPNYANAYNNRGTAKNSLGQHVEAIADYDEVIRLNPDHALAYTNRGVAKDSLGEHKDAITDYNQAIRLKPDYAEAYNNRGNAKDCLGQHVDAINDYNQAIRLNPDYAEAYNNRGHAKYRLGEHKDAITDYDKAIRLDPDYALAYINRGVAKNRLGRHVDAIADYDQAIRLNPDDAAAYNNRGTAKDSLGQYVDAINDYDQAIRLNPDYADAYFNCGLAYLATNQPEEARRDLETARNLAQQAGDENLAAAADQGLRNLDAPDEGE